MGIDDFAFCKGHTYGTLICDLETHCPLAILPNRLPETVTAWLQNHPFIKVVSRDGFTGYRQGISNANHSILQVYDRWHFIQNAKKHLDTILCTLIPPLITWYEAPKNPQKIQLTRAEQITKERQTQKWKLIQGIQMEHRNGRSLSRLAREYQLDRRTIKKYIQMTLPPISQRRRKRPANQYYNQIIELELEGKTVKTIYEILKQNGYDDTFSSIRKVVEKVRKERKHQISKNDIFQLSRRKLSAIIWKLAENLNLNETSSLEKCLNKYGRLKPLYDIIQTYRKSLQTRDYNLFLKWLTEQLSNRENPFYHYALRLRSDLQAVKNSFLLPYSNGLSEGQINRLKTIKRMTYGRAGLKLLEKRVLYRL
ncbi:MAG TPA: ISL3 family transposase [Bacillus bacterium]|nr:ISL3 family transposase [Bacillus sp. (in: firmicutes)]